MSDKCRIHHKEESRAVGWMLHSSVDDAKYYVGRLTDEEIEYCSRREDRLTVRKLLVKEMNKRVAKKVEEANILP